MRHIFEFEREPLVFTTEIATWCYKDDPKLAQTMWHKMVFRNQRVNGIQSNATWVPIRLYDNLEELNTDLAEFCAKAKLDNFHEIHDNDKELFNETDTFNISFLNKDLNINNEKVYSTFKYFMVHNERSNGTIIPIAAGPCEFKVSHG